MGYIKDDTYYIAYNANEIALLEPTYGDIAVTVEPALYKILRQDTNKLLHYQQSFSSIDF